MMQPNLAFSHMKFGVKFSFTLLFCMPLLGYSETISYSTEICAAESKRMGKTLGTMARMTTDPNILKENQINTEKERLMYVEQVPGYIAQALDKNFKGWAEQEQKEERPFWKKWINFQKLIGAYVGEKSIALWGVDPTLTAERYERLLFQQCMERWAGSYEVTLERPSLPTLPSPTESSVNTTIIQSVPSKREPMGSQLNKCQQDGGQLTCINHPTDVRMPRGGKTPYQ